MEEGGGLEKGVHAGLTGTPLCLFQGSHKEGLTMHSIAATLPSAPFLSFLKELSSPFFPHEFGLRRQGLQARSNR